VYVDRSLALLIKQEFEKEGARKAEKRKKAIIKLINLQTTDQK
jgi:hypothetical protein